MHVGTTWIGDDANCVSYLTFESEVIMLQHGDEENLNRSEARSVSCLLLPFQNPNPSAVMESENAVDMLMKIQPKKKTSRVQNKYMDPSFVLGSVAEVERLWSVAASIL